MLYKYEFFRENMENSFFFAIGVRPETIEDLMLDFFNLALVAMYLFYCKNPILGYKVAYITWCFHYKVHNVPKFQTIEDRFNKFEVSSDPEDISPFSYKLGDYDKLVEENYV